MGIKWERERVGVGEGTESGVLPELQTLKQLRQRVK